MRARGTGLDSWREVSEDEDRIVFDLTQSYPQEARISSLRREARLVRDHEGYVEIIDEVAFSGNETGVMVEHILSYNEIVGDSGGLRTPGRNADLHVLCSNELRIEIEFLEEAVGQKDVYRARLMVPQGNRQRVALRFVPQKKPNP